MPVPNIRLIFCDDCGKLLKTEQFGDALTPMEWEQMQNTQRKHHCLNVEVRHF